MKIDIKFINTDEEFHTCLSIRRQVFIIGQSIPETIEMDDNTIEATYVLATMNGNPVGTARFRPTEIGMKLERFAVLEQYRNLGIGKALVLFILDTLKSEKLIYLNAQESVIEFYEKLGFNQVGDRFVEAEIPHQKMVYLG